MPEIVPAELFLTGPEGESRPIIIKTSPFIIGRADIAHLAQPGDTMLSRQHCAFEWMGDAWQLRDLGSKNGTTLNGQPVVKETRLEPGDRIVAGRQILEFERNKAATAQRRSGPLEFVEEGDGQIRPDSTFIIRLDSAKLSTKPAGAPSMELDRANKRMEALVRAGRELASFRPLQELFDVTLDLALESVGAKRGVLMTLEDGELVAKAHRGEGFRVSSAVRDKVMRERASLLVADANSDSLLRASQTIVQQRIKSLMAVPLQTESHVIGILYVDSPNIIHPFDADDLSLLTVFANIAAIRIEHARLVEVEHVERLMMHDLEQAAEIQRNVFPQSAPTLPGLELAGRTLPSRSVGGDYFDYIAMEDGRTLALVADVSGKGLPAALVVSSVQARVHALSEVHTEVGKLVTRLNTGLKKITPDNKFVTAFFAAIEPESGLMEFTNAGHNPPIIVRANGEIELVSGGGPVLAILSNFPYPSGRGVLRTGDILVMYSDGVSEALNAAGEEFGEDTVATVAAGCRHLSAEGILTEIARQLKDFLGECAPNDDITLLVAKKL